MNYFLDESWVTLLAQSGSIHRAMELRVAGLPVWVGEYRNVRQKKWQLYGAWEEGETQAWLQELFALGRHHGVFQIECAFNMARWTDKTLLQQLGARITDEFGTSIVDLSQDEGQLWANLHGKHRNKINRARRDAIQVRILEDVHEFIGLMDNSYAKGGVSNPFPPDYLRSLLSLTGPRLLAMGAYSALGLEAGAVVPLDARRGYFLHGATLPNGISGAAQLLHWEMMLELKRRQVAVYDLGGVRRSTEDARLRGIFQFKERFGGRFQPCWYWYRVIHPGRKLFHDLMVRLRG
ncbi:MAG: peptidoglycan bridge formation glycyltransferase FemA/FemB family protein [Magnetococcales bacterium]|nr:peptidoglycan bridge formation glycyltransferase FemA/FemB family protein [Magnetococcales bacterium]